MKKKLQPQLNQRINRLFDINIKSVDEDKRQVTFCFSDNSKDRYGEIVDQASWDVKSYKANPIILWGHDSSNPENVIGQGVDLQLDQAGKSFITAQFDDAETNPKADLIFRQLVKKTLRCVSAGFIPHSLEWDEDTPILKDNELLEVSVVAIPANRNAVALSLKSGEIRRKDAEFLLKSMREGAEAIEAELKNAPDDTDDTTVKELAEQMKTLATSLGNLADEVRAIKEAVTAKQEPTPPVPDPNDVPTPANGGSDQPGAGEDAIDLDTELSDEQLDADIEEEATNE